MFGIFLALFLAGVLALIVYLTQEKEDKNPILLILMLGYFLRLLVRSFNRNLDFFSSGQTLGGNDAVNYEATAKQIAELWHVTGVHFVTNPEIDVAAAALPHNLLALQEYLNGGYSAIASVSVVAFLACLTALVLYKTYSLYDSKRETSLFVMSIVLFVPSFLVFTSDSYKDGILIFFTVSIFATFFHLTSRNFYFLIPFLILCFAGLMGTRYYLIYALLPAVFIFVFQIQIRIFFNCLILCLIVLAVAYFQFFDVIIEKWNYFTYISGALQADNIYSGGSLISLDGKSPALENFPIKILYTLFSPFPWQEGSFGLHLSKIEMLFWCFILYWAFKGILIFFKQDPVKVLMLLSFIVGLTLVYSWSFTNIGQIYRQRLVIFYVASILAVWGRVASKQKAQVS